MENQIKDMRIVLKNTIKVSAFLIFFLFLIALCLSSPSSSSFSITTFNDTTSAKNLTFTTSENKTAYIEIPRYVNVIDAKLNLSGYNYWGENTTFKSGIAGSSSAEMGFDIYTIDGLIQMIRVDYWGNLEGYTWNGTAWETNNTIISDLPTSTFNESKPGIYTIDNKPIMMINNHTWQNWIWGYEWNGTSWKRNNTFDYVASSAITSGADIASDIYTIDGLTHMIIGSYSGKFEGATWNGTDWIRNTTLETGLVGIDLGFRSRPAFYKLDGKIALISGNWTGKWTGWIWNGTQWINNTDVLNGLVQTDIESSGSIYTIDNKIVFVTYKANDKWRSYVYDHPNSPYLDVSGDGNIEWSLPDAEFQGSIAYLEKLNDSSTAKNSTFTTSENKTIWVKIPKNADVTDAKLNLSGYSVEESQNNNTDADISVRSNTPYYFAEDLWVGFDSAAGYEEFRAYLRFPLSLPDNIKIKNATLSLYKLVDIGAESANYDAHHVYDHTWDGEDDTSMRWSTQVCGVNFDDSTDCNLTAENSIQVSSGWNNWTVTNAVKKEYEEGDLNISFALRVASSIDDASKFDNMAGTYIPYLVVEYEYYPTSPYLDVGGDGDKQWEYGEDIDELKDDDGNILTGDYTYYMLVGDKTSQLLNITCVQPVDEFWILSINDEQKMLECSNGTQSLDETYVNSYAVNKIYFGGSGSHTDQLRLENPRDYVYNPGGEYNESVSPERTADFSQEINDYLSTCSPNANGECDVPLVLHSDTAGKIQISDIDIQYNYQTTPNFSSEINNILPDCSCSDCSLSNDNCTFPLVVHSDTAGIIQLDALNITYEDVKAPLWNDTTGYLGSNASVISKGDPILLYGMGKDDIALDYAWLETNETGDWENKTYKSEYVKDMQDASNTWTWSNFTWQNSSITEGTTVGWRIYYNDTSGNENKTVINTFYIKQKFYPNMTQSVSVVDLISRLYSGERINIQSTVFTLIISRIFNSLRALSQVLSITDIVTRLYNAVVSIAQSLNFTTIISRLIKGFRTLTQTSTITDALTYAVSRFGEGILSLSLSITDVLSRTLSSFRALPQSFTLTDIISKIRGVSNALTQIISFTSTRIYNFLDTINNKAYNNSVAEKPPTSLSPAGEQEFSSESYTNISSSDNDYFTTESYDYPYHKFNITINELLNEIQRIKVTWEGHSTILGNISLHIYNFTSGDWGPILDYNNGTVDFNLDKEYTTDFEDLINDSKMFILVQDQEEWTYKLTNTSSLTPLEDIDAMLDWGDVDSDGTNELVIISGANVYIYNHSVGEWLLESNWVSAEFSSTLYESGLCIGDVDGDNYQELVVRSETGDDIYIYENGSSTIEYTITTGEVEGGIGCGDLDGNGTVEMWYLNSSDIIIREWNGTDFRVALTTTFSNNAASGDLGDYDGDGDLEVAFADGDQVKILNSTYDIETTFSVSIDGQPHISFFNLSNQNSDELIIYDNNGIHVYNWTGSTFVEKINFAADSESSTYNEERFTAGDIDSDGRIELLVKDGNYLKTYTFMIGEVSTDYIEIKVTSSTITVKRIFSSIKILLQTLNLNVVLSRVYSGLRTLTQTLQITDALTQIYNSLRALSQILSITDVLSRLREVPRTLTQALNFNFIISRLTNIYRTMVQQVTVTSILSKVASILKSLLQLLKLTAEVSRIKVHYYDAIQYDPPNITAATSYDVKFNKTIEIDNLGQIRDGFISLSVSLPTGTDLWYIYEGNICSGIVQASGSGTTASWTADALSNTKSNESLCYVYTDGVTGSSLTFTQDTSVISNDTTQFIKATWTVTENVGEDFNISWDLTDLMYSGSTCYANCSNSSYTVTFGFSRIVKGYGDWVTKSEGDRIKVGDAWMNQNVSFTKDNGYTNTFDSSLTINTTATLPSCYVQPSVNLTNSTDHEQTIGGYGSTYIYWNATVPTVGETYTIDFKTPILNVTRNETETVVSWYRYFNMNGTCVDVSNVHVNASIPEDRTAFTLSDNTTGAMTDVTDDPDYNVYFYDLDADGYSDLISWTIPILSADTEEKFVIEGKGVTCSMVSREITNVPLRTMESLIWKETIKCSNSANSSVSYSQKWRMLLGVRDVELDDIAKNLLYDEYGAYIMLTGSLAGGESENRILEYVSDPVTAEARYYYPVDRDEDYVVDEDAYLIINITIHNWSPFDVNETIEKEIPIIYLENVKVYFNDSEIDSEDEILGKYVLEVESIDAGKEKEYQINGTFPTATSTLLIERPEPERGLKVRVYNIKSVTPYVMSELHFIPDIVYNETQEAYRVSYPDLEELEALNWTSKEGNPDFNLGSFAVGIEKYVLIYYGKITPIPDPLEKWIKFLQREVYVPVISVYLARKFAIWELGVVGFSGFLVMVFVYYYWKKKKLGVPFRLKLPKIGRPKIRLPFRHSKKKEKEPEVESEEELF